MISKQEQAEFLAEAMPYIKKYNDKILVIKYGGNAMINEELKTSVMRDLVLLQLVGIKVVLVHVGGPEISEMLKRVGIESRFVNGLRYTDAETAEIVRMVLAGKINKALVNQLETCGGKAVGLSGIDGHMLGCEKESEELGFVGKIVDVDIRIIEDCLKSGYIPVVSTVGYDNFGNVYNINADTAAAAIAIALHAEKFVSMTDIVGLLYDKDDESTLIPEVEISEIEGYKAHGVISGGMIPKIEGMADAIYEGVHEAVIIDGRVPHSVLLEMFSDRGSGTLFYRRGNR